MGAPLSAFNALMLEKSLEIFNFLIKVLTFLMSFKSTLYRLYFQKFLRCEVMNSEFWNIFQWNSIGFSDRIPIGTVPSPVGCFEVSQFLSKTKVA
jgi:hypothetical protein